MKIKQYIESGVLESYVLGSASDDEITELLQLKRDYPEIQDALFELELDLERLAQYGAITPPPGILSRIEDDINALVNAPKAVPEVLNSGGGAGNGHTARDRSSHFIEVEAASSDMRIHKAWRWVFAAVFLLGKIFLIGFIYFYLANKQAQDQIQQLKLELQHYKHIK